MKRIIPFTLITLMSVSCSNQNQKQIETKPYPETRKDLSVTDNYFGTEVADPYRWLEDDRSDETAAWVKAQNDVTFDYLGQIPYRTAIKERLLELFDYPKYGAPFKKGDYYFFFKNDGLQNQHVLFRQKGIDGEPEVFLDPNTLSADGTVALGGISFSKDNKYMAYTVSKSGSDWTEIFVMDVETKEKLADHILRVKFSEASWAPDGFFYSSYDAPKEGSLYSGKNEFQKVYFHRLGTDQSADVVVYEDKAHPLRYFHAEVSRDNKWLFIDASEGTHGTEILYRPVGSNAPFQVLFHGFEYDYSIVRCENDRALVFTNDGAENFRLAEVNLADAKPVLKDLIPEKSDLLENVTLGGPFIFANYLKDASTRVYQYSLQGELIREIELPSIGTAGGFSGEPDENLLFYSFSTFNYPPTTFSYDAETGQSTLFRKTEVPFDPTDFVVEQQFFTSKDGTQVPMFIVHKKGLKKDGNNPTHLYAYGGFNISQTPVFTPTLVMFMEQGGIFVLANIRGGGEYGEAWHKGGMLKNKQNVFDDFIGAGEYLIAEGYTSKDKLAISGGSNGGLLIGACMTQRPDLFAVCFPRVGVLDMLRYHKFTIGWGWVVEYGSSDSEEYFDYLHAYSPLHNVKEGTCYPATMVMTADHDDRVVPAHSFKFAAELQAKQGCPNPVLIRIEADAGHGAGKPLSKQLDEVADMYAFLFWNTNSTVNYAQK
ncbi:prolyl oligopeptidase family serine peptidase [Alistipes sp. OttesenSCG-928-L06]|nr:prolyl oligopeptidase family serine peptidase [Alistipes sp. OttesenSCG-928-L06]